MSWLLLGVAVESLCLAFGWPFSPPLHKSAYKTDLCHVGLPFWAVKLFSHSIGMTIGAKSHECLESRCGLSHESAQDGCNGTCVKLGALKSTCSGNTACLGDP